MMLNGSKMYNIPESLLYFRFSPEMCKRRGGWKYAYVEMRFQRQLQKLGYIGILMMMTNICIRLVTRLVPNSLRGWIYKKFLRNSCTFLCRQVHPKYRKVILLIFLSFGYYIIKTQVHSPTM